MTPDRNYLLMTYILMAGIFIILSCGVSQTMGQLDDNNHAATLDDNSVQGNNTIILNPSEINGTYRWVNSSGGVNPTLDITKGNEYQIKINNPTDEEHELIIDNEKKSKVGGSDHIEPGKNTEFEFKTMNAGELNYYCEYHPETMRGIIKVIEPTQ
ncbi:MAG TPA: cupredoxin domain-containing protein [Nitrososphaeraceae archaeon]|nr:cupredoxin domain-containing protein [Nitrososphaeraceae archaeon]